MSLKKTSSNRVSSQKKQQRSLPNWYPVANGVLNCLIGGLLVIVLILGVQVLKAYRPGLISSSSGLASSELEPGEFEVAPETPNDASATPVEPLFSATEIAELTPSEAREALTQLDVRSADALRVNADLIRVAAEPTTNLTLTECRAEPFVISAKITEQVAIANQAATASTLSFGGDSEVTVEPGSTATLSLDFETGPGIYAFSCRQDSAQTGSASTVDFSSNVAGYLVLDSAN